MLAGPALGVAFADADDGDQARRERRHGLGAHLRVALVLVGAALAMAEDDERAPGFVDHRRRDAAGMGAALPPRGSPGRRWRGRPSG